MRYYLFAALWVPVCLWADTTFLQSPVTFSQLETYFERRPDITTVEAFLHELPQENLSHYVLMHTSGSLQGSSLEQPRALSTTLDSNFGLAFTGSDKQARGNTVEMWQFDRQTHRFEFREVSFDGKKAHLSAANPPLCLGCHGADPRPIWGAYPVWKGAYAEFRDGGFNADSRDIQKKNAAFNRKRATTPRYKELINVQKDEESSLNVGFMHLVFESNSLRVGRKLMATPFYAEYKYAALGAILCLHSKNRFFEDFLPKALADQHLKTFDAAKHKRDNSPGAFEVFDYLFDARGVSTADWATVVDSLDARSSSRFADTDLRDYEYQAPARLGYGWAKVDEEIGLLADVARAHDGGSVVAIQPKPYVFLREPSTPDCVNLAQKSQSALEGLLKKHSPAEIFRLSAQASQRSPREVLQSCAHCHGDAGNHKVPFIPFGDVPALVTWLQTNPDMRAKIAERVAADAGKRQMPPGSPLPAGEREALVTFVNAL